MYQFLKHIHFDNYRKLTFVTDCFVRSLLDGANISSGTHFIPPQTSILDHTSVIFENNVTIDCHLTGIPPPDIIWLLNDVRRF